MGHSFDFDESSLKKQTIDEFVRSITRIENAFANVLNGQAEFLKKNRDKLTHEQLLKFNDNLEEIIKLAIKKEIILEFLLGEIKKCPEKCRKERCHCKHFEEESSSLCEQFEEESSSLCSYCKKRCSCKHCEDKEECLWKDCNKKSCHCKECKDDYHFQYEYCSHCMDHGFICKCFERKGRPQKYKWD